MQAFIRQMSYVLYILYTQIHMQYTDIYTYTYMLQFEHWRQIIFFLTSFFSDFIKLNKYSISLNVMKSRTIILKAAQKVNDNNYIVLCNSMGVLYNRESIVTDFHFFHFTMIKKYFNDDTQFTVYILPRPPDIIYYFCMPIASSQNFFFLCFQCPST